MSEAGRKSKASRTISAWVRPAKALTFDQVRVLARNSANEYVATMRDLTATDRRHLGARLALHEHLLALWWQIAVVPDGDHASMVELVERRAEVIEELERCSTGSDAQVTPPLVLHLGFARQRVPDDSLKLFLSVFWF